MIKFPPLKKSKLDGAASSYFNGMYIYTHLNALCRLFHILNDHAFQRSACRQKMMMYEAKGDGLQTYALCQQGCKYEIFIFNDPLPKTH